MLLGCIADDFTGASDLANTLAKGSMATMQFVGVPNKQMTSIECEAGVVALKTRSIAAGAAVAQSLEALAWLREQGCRQFLFKYCSTFDSTPRGNIGPVAEALLDATGGASAVVCPVFPATGRTLYGGHLFVKGRLLSESGMENHPINPMTDPDIRRWLERQTQGKVGLVSYEIVRRGASQIRAALDDEAIAGRRLVVVDALTDDDLIAIGTAVAADSLVTGGSGIALGLPGNFLRKGLLGGSAHEFPKAHGPAVVLSGSCSNTSRLQVASYLQAHPGLAVDPDKLMSGSIDPESAAAFVRGHLDASPIVYSTADPAAVQRAQERYGRIEVAGAIEAFFGNVARRLVGDGVRRIVVGGGETAGAVVTALGVEALFVGPELDPGVPILASLNQTPMHLVLKSGNFGAVDFFEKAVR